MRQRSVQRGALKYRGRSIKGAICRPVGTRPSSPSPRGDGTKSLLSNMFLKERLEVHLDGEELYSSS
jgi:hypothetical protein